MSDDIQIPKSNAHIPGQNTNELIDALIQMYPQSTYQSHFQEAQLPSFRIRYYISIQCITFLVAFVLLYYE